MNKKELLKKTIESFGVNHQIDIAIEEMAELTKELIKFKRGKSNKYEIQEEIADVRIMIEQLRIIFDRGVVKHEEGLKLIRLSKTISLRDKINGNV